jgi:hypothetical protein
MVKNIFSANRPELKSVFRNPISSVKQDKAKRSLYLDAVFDSTATPALAPSTPWREKIRLAVLHKPMTNLTKTNKTDTLPRLDISLPYSPGNGLKSLKTSVKTNQYRTGYLKLQAQLDNRSWHVKLFRPTLKTKVIAFEDNCVLPLGTAIKRNEINAEKSMIEVNQFSFMGELVVRSYQTKKEFSAAGPFRTAF